MFGVGLVCNWRPPHLTDALVPHAYVLSGATATARLWGQDKWLETPDPGPGAYETVLTSFEVNRSGPSLLRTLLCSTVTFCSLAHTLYGNSTGWAER